MSRARLILAHTFWPTGSTASAWRVKGAYNGSIFHPGLLVDAAHTAECDFVDHVVFDLQRRGLARTRYETHTLREHLGLSRLKSAFRGAPRAGC